MSAQKDVKQALQTSEATEMEDMGHKYSQRSRSEKL
jgi:hypothetical protein